MPICKRKTCASSGDQPVDNFYKDRSMKSGLDKYCKVCRTTIHRNAYSNLEMTNRTKEWKSRNKTRVRSNRLRYEYGIDLAKYKSMLEKQEGKCAGCLRHQSEFKIALAVDHCHRTGKVRGLLCSACNKGIGLLKDDPKLLLRLAEYLKNE